MAYPIRADIIPLLRHLAGAIQPVAEANFVDFRFESEIGQFDILFQPEATIRDLTQLLCRVITFTPQNFAVRLKILPSGGQEGHLCLHVHSTGPYLGSLEQIREGLSRPVGVFQPREGGTTFEWILHPPAPAIEHHPNEEAPPIPVFFHKLRQSLYRYAINTAQLEEAARVRSERDGVFLQKVNALLLANLGREDFDTAALCRALALSRSQLYRRLTPLTKLPPARYLQFLRLSKAREFLETGTSTVTETAFRVGFKDKSHFTRVFRKHFGFNPSHLRRKDGI